MSANNTTAFQGASASPDLLDTSSRSANDYRFFKGKDGTFIIKVMRIPSIIFGLFFFALGINALTVPTPSESVVGISIAVLFVFFLAFIFLNAAFTKTIVDPINKNIRRTGLLPFLNRCYPFNSIAGIHLIRINVNYIFYIKTSINMHFHTTGKKDKKLTINALRKSENIEHFIDELYDIIGKAPDQAIHTNPG